MERVARGERSEAPGIRNEEPLRPERAQDFTWVQRLDLASLPDATALLADEARGCASLAPGYLPASLRDARLAYWNASFSVHV
jgi:hypothetical protein